MPLFSSKSPHTYDQIPQSRSSSDSIVSDNEHVEGFGEARNSARSPPPFESRNSEQINPLYISDADADSESSSSFLPVNGSFPFLWNGQASPRSARNQRRRRRLRGEGGNRFRTIKKWLRSLARHRLFPTKPLSIDPVPWRIYCSIPSTSTLPPTHLIPALDQVFTVQLPKGADPLSSPELTTPQFPPDNLDDLPPAGVFLGIFSMDSGMERRMLIRTTWASHLRSRFGATDSDNGRGTSRTIVRFVLGKPRSEWERRVRLEAETYNDIIILPIKENMNSGKSHAYFSWSADHAWVPPPISTHPDYQLTYTNESIPAPPLAFHDPKPDASFGQSNWVRPDFVLKADDDTFIMLAELEARLRVQLDEALKPSVSQSPTGSDKIIQTKELESTYDSLPHSDPLIYFGYLVKNHFMAGEMYGLSWALTRWVSMEPKLRNMVRGAEDKQTAKWMKCHPREHQIRWASERGWIYDHPRAGTVYSHGFLFPSEASRVRHSVISFLRPLASGTPEDTSNFLPTYISPNINHPNDTITYVLPPQTDPASPSFAYSSVSQFHKTYKFPLPGLTPQESIEALVEGSHMSKLIENGPETAAQAWMRREHLLQRYEGKRVGGTVVVHFIKRNEWFLETAMAFLGDDGAEHSS
ncbi:hypothetical protein Clacol_008144 [Clathrus columnatus]|uniref:Glycosyltransferase family 31 protein n=1 Tax=Clathrus columnatus TaxID=1419009 RepID=A0AAV5AJN1_9AGAM|nr:hypothetical protein Clacol_008144 [Clathrus columnatus]